MIVPVTVRLDGRLKDQIDRHFADNSSMAGAGILAFLRSEPEDQARMLKEYKDLKDDPRETVNHQGVKAKR